MKVTVLESKREELQKMIASFNRKAKKYGQSIKAEFGKAYSTKQRYYVKNEFKGWDMVEVFDLVIEAEEIKCGDYKVVAKIDHIGEGKNIVFTFGCEAKKDWFTTYCKCDHCNQKRSRNVTYIVSNGSDDRQIGSSCLKEYSGINPEFIVSLRSFEDSIELMDVESYEMNESDHYSNDCYEIERMITIAIKVLEKQGYVSSGT